MEKDIPNIYENNFGKNIPFWTDGYFACSVGNVSEEMLKGYIRRGNQGWERRGDSGCKGI